MKKEIILMTTGAGLICAVLAQQEQAKLTGPNPVNPESLKQRIKVFQYLAIGAGFFSLVLGMYEFTKK